MLSFSLLSLCLMGWEQKQGGCNFNLRVEALYDLTKDLFSQFSYFGIEEK